MLQRLKLPANLDGMAWRYANPAGANRRHHHAELELNLVTRGAGTYLLGNRQYQIRRGDLLWLFPAQEHVLIEQTPDFEMWIVVFRRRLIKRSCRRSRVDSPATAQLLRRHLPSPAATGSRALRGTLRAARRIASEPGLLNAGLAYALLHAWKCFDHAGEVPERSLHPAVERTASLLLSDENSYSLPQLSRKAGLSPSRLSRLFKQQTGLSIVEFRNRQRMQRFLERYEVSNATPAGRARCSTPPSPRASAATRSSIASFDEVTGCSPAEYQRRTATNPQALAATASRSPAAELSPPPNCSGRWRAHSHPRPARAPDR